MKSFARLASLGGRRHGQILFGVIRYNQLGGRQGFYRPCDGLVPPIRSGRSLDLKQDLLAPKLVGAKVSNIAGHDTLRRFGAGILWRIGSHPKRRHMPVVCEQVFPDWVWSER